MATWKRLELSTSSVTGWHSNQLNYQAAWDIKKLSGDPWGIQMLRICRARCRSHIAG